MEIIILHTYSSSKLDGFEIETSVGKSQDRDALATHRPGNYQTGSGSSFGYYGYLLLLWVVWTVFLFLASSLALCLGESGLPPPKRMLKPTPQESSCDSRQVVCKGQARDVRCRIISGERAGGG